MWQNGLGKGLCNVARCKDLKVPAPCCSQYLRRILSRRIFKSARTWCHVLVIDCSEDANSLQRQYHKLAFDRDVSIYSAVLDVAAMLYTG